MGEFLKKPKSVINETQPTVVAHQWYHLLPDTLALYFISYYYIVLFVWSHFVPLVTFATDAQFVFFRFFQ